LLPIAWPEPVLHDAWRIAAASHGTLLAVGSRLGSVAFFNDHGSELTVVPVGGSMVLSLAFSSTDQLLFVGLADGTLAAISVPDYCGCPSGAFEGSSGVHGDRATLACRVVASTILPDAGPARALAPIGPASVVAAAHEAIYIFTITHPPVRPTFIGSLPSPRSPPSHRPARGRPRGRKPSIPAVAADETASQALPRLILTADVARAPHAVSALAVLPTPYRGHQTALIFAAAVDGVLRTYEMSLQSEVFATPSGSVESPKLLPTGRLVSEAPDDAPDYLWTVDAFPLEGGAVCAFAGEAGAVHFAVIPS
jgi:hypothetical protein